MSTRLNPPQCRAPHVHIKVWGGVAYRVRLDPYTHQVMVGDEEMDGFVERMRLLGRHDVLVDIANSPVVIHEAAGSTGREVKAPQPPSAFEMHQQRSRRRPAT